MPICWFCHASAHIVFFQWCSVFVVCGRVVKDAVARHLTAVGSSITRVICETSQVLPAGGQLIFLGDLPFSPENE